MKYFIEDRTSMHDHGHAQTGMKNLAIALAITFCFLIIELVGGFLTNSLALITDALHMLNDSLALVFSLIAAWLAQRPITIRRTYGYRRAEVLAAFINGILLWIVVIFIFQEAYQRFQEPVEVQSLNMLIISVLGLLANGLSAITLSRSRNESLNIRGAFLHVLADVLGSLGAISAGLIMFFTGWYQADPLISMMIGILIFFSSGRLIKESVNILLEGVPPQVDINAVSRRITEQDGVERLHDLHVWCITPPECLMSAHIVVKEGIDRKKLMETLITMLDREFGIEHTTIQFEGEDYPKAHDEHENPT
ncbi:MAG: cation transporter [Candidatus Bathyarchaeota archaeon]|nr:MAG: cation transporter [Candidatus Bathyarchaeota archaeon]